MHLSRNLLVLVSFLLSLPPLAVNSAGAQDWHPQPLTREPVSTFRPIQNSTVPAEPTTTTLRVPASATWLTSDQRAFFQAIIDKSAAIGNTERARRMASDIAQGRIKFLKDEPGVRASTQWHFVGSNTMELPQDTLDRWRNLNTNIGSLRNKVNTAEQTKKAQYAALLQDSERENRRLLLDMALTVDHEYVHMDQKYPSEDPQSENPAWRHRLDEEKRLINEKSQQLEDAISHDVDDAQLNSLIQELEDIAQIHQGSVGELKDKIEPSANPGEKPPDPTLTASLFEQDRQSIDGEMKKINQLIDRAKKKMHDRAVKVASTPPVEPPKKVRAAAINLNGNWLCTVKTLGGEVTTKFGTQNLPSGLTYSYPTKIVQSDSQITLESQGGSVTLDGALNGNVWQMQKSTPPPTGSSTKMSLYYNLDTDAVEGEVEETQYGPGTQSVTRMSYKFIRQK